MDKRYLGIGLSFLIIGVGCNPSDRESTNRESTSMMSSLPTDPRSSTSATNDANVRDHSVVGHAHGAGPHDGTIVDWGGGKYHVEFTVDHDKQQATVYILGSDEKTAVPINATSIELSIREPELLLALQADPLASDPPGQASRFVGKDEKLGTVKAFAGTLTGVIDGTPYSGDFDEAASEAH